MKETKQKRTVHRPRAEVARLVQQAENLVKQGMMVKDACATVGVTPGVLHRHRARARGKGITPSATTPNRLKYCPQCGCNLQVISAALSL